MAECMFQKEFLKGKNDFYSRNTWEKNYSTPRCGRTILRKSMLIYNDKVDVCLLTDAPPQKKKKKTLNYL